MAMQKTTAAQVPTTHLNVSIITKSRKWVCTIEILYILMYSGDSLRTYAVYCTRGKEGCRAFKSAIAILDIL